ncbi:uncharacterized protein L969DRAFT_84541 [Mixia osmundae IAM 14324]|uniref:Pre-mRNA polyadenylation factor Fip1 domain-containing protein n=1 Tax=Mixia osmundae (strain CBS 9802 / IAM 14324 / JCM 22182 / KY 12970) TaxID=764103 RepID=G7E563_MIXOS|nr:uncharacterized protein L969DRAFT_84541 [Mixia osmundae IAM 14324]KEI42670.1 hypothetical protein L969DRAFT_84541 [Mixia osmundae IAM 14324]GAA97973.1 hypothetical protein E5Q_04653 [Mixia osmundae IAM 14324]
MNDDDDDAFLYGSSIAPPPSNAQPSKPQNVPISTNGSGVTQQPASTTVDIDEGGEEDIEEDGSSESDLDIILDAPDPVAPPGFNPHAARLPILPQRPVAIASPGVQPAALAAPAQQQALLSAGTSNAATPIASGSATLNGHGQLYPPEVIPGTLNQIPSADPSQALTIPSMRPTVDLTKPAMLHTAQNIYELNIDSLPQTPWREPGIDLSEYFNYGFDEMTWRAYAKQQLQLRAERDEERMNPFAAFANQPVEEAWASLPLELKGMMMQTIMSSFGGMPGMGMGMPAMPPGMPMMSGMPAMPGMPSMPAMPMPPQQDSPFGDREEEPRGSRPRGRLGVRPMTRENSTDSRDQPPADAPRGPRIKAEDEQSIDEEPERKRRAPPLRRRRSSGEPERRAKDSDNERKRRDLTHDSDAATHTDRLSPDSDRDRGTKRTPEGRRPSVDFAFSERTKSSRRVRDVSPEERRSRRRDDAVPSTRSRRRSRSPAQRSRSRSPRRHVEEEEAPRKRMRRRDV